MKRTSRRQSRQPAQPVLRTATVQPGAQLRTLASTVRQELIDTLQALGTASVPELAAQVGRPADALYYHMRALLKAGLVVAAGSRRQGRHAEILYRTPAPDHRLELRYRADDGSTDRAALGKVVDQMLRASGRAFARALADPGCVTEGAARELWAGRISGWLSPAGIKQANRLLLELGALFARHPAGAGRRLYALQFLLSPGGAASTRRQASEPDQERTDS